MTPNCTFLTSLGHDFNVLNQEDNRYLVTFPEYGNQELVRLGSIMLQAKTDKSPPRRSGGGGGESGDRHKGTNGSGGGSGSDRQRSRWADATNYRRFGERGE